MFEFPPDDDLHPKRLLDRLMQTHEELFAIRDMEPKIAVLFRTEEQVKNGRMILGTCYMPQVQGELRGLFDELLTEKLGFFPDFLIVLSKPFWEMADDQTKEALMFHEALHMGQATDKYGTPRFNLMTGDPIFGLVAHDIEEFIAVVNRYQRTLPDVGRFLDAAKAAGAV